MDSVLQPSGDTMASTNYKCSEENCSSLKVSWHLLFPSYMASLCQYETPNVLSFYEIGCSSLHRDALFLVWAPQVFLG